MDIVKKTQKAVATATATITKNANISWLWIAIAVVAIATVMVRYADKVNKLRVLSADGSAALKRDELIEKTREHLKSKNRKPVLWIFVDHEYNSMLWSSFYSRSNFNMNVPYIKLAVEKTIKHNTDDFHICIINDKAFSHLLPGWRTNIEAIGKPLREKVRYIAMVSLLHEYGGLLVPSSFAATKSLRPVYDAAATATGPFAFENVNYHNYTGDGATTFCPDPHFVAAKRECPLLGEYKNYLERNASRDYTAESVFLNDNAKWLALAIRGGKMGLIGAEKIGAKLRTGEPVQVQDIVSTNPVPLIPDHELLGVCYPQSELIKRKEYKWFCYLTAQELASSNMFMAKFLL
jgi:hypothetical protein